MKKICLLLVAAMLCTLANGCTKKEQSDIPTITWYMSQPEAQCRDQKLIEQEANKIIEPAVGARLHFCFFDYATFEQKMSVMISAGEEFDIMQTSSWKNRFDQNVAKGALMDLTDLIDKYGQDIVKKSDPGAFDAVTINGKVLAIPSQTPWVKETAIVFKKDLVDKYGFDYKSVKSIEDLEPYLETIKQNEPGIIPFFATADGSLGNSGNPGYESAGTAMLYDIANDKFVPAFETPAYVEQFRTYYNYYQKGYIAKDAATRMDGVTECKTGKYAVLRDAGAYSEDGSKSSATYGYPCYETLIGMSTVTNTMVTSVMNGISSTSKHPVEAIKILNLIWKDPKLSNLLAFGVENVNYTIENKGTPDEIVVPKSGNEQRWGIAHNSIGPLWDQWNSTWNSTEALERMRENNQIADKSKLLGFFVDTEPVKTQIAAVSSIITEITPVLQTGTMPDFDKYIEKVVSRLNDAGMHEIIDEYERQYTEWKKLNR